MTPRPQGTITRGTTHPNRLRRFDRWIIHRMAPSLRRHPSPLVVDLGYGSRAITTGELAARLRSAVGRPITVVGVEIDPQRVAEAQHLARPGLSFVRGGFEVPVVGDPLVIRAANVLRQYEESEVAGAWARMAARLAPGGVLVEGTCDELGRLASWVALGPVARGGAVAPDSLTISVDLRSLQRPGAVAERLPKALIHRNVPGEPVHALLTAMDRAWEVRADQRVFGPRQRWLAMVELLRASGTPVLDGPARWRLGELSVPWQVVAPPT